MKKTTNFTIGNANISTTTLHILRASQALRDLQFPFFARVKFAYHTENCAFLIYDTVPNGELRRFSGESGRFSEDIVRYYAAEIALALERLHSLGFVYKYVNSTFIARARSLSLSLCTYLCEYKNQRGRE
jgi:serine/threonine protein kinase